MLLRVCAVCSLLLRIPSSLTFFSELEVCLFIELTLPSITRVEAFFVSSCGYLVVARRVREFAEAYLFRGLVATASASVGLRLFREVLRFIYLE